jgi:DNA-3-methyladenine glycosylase II
VKSGAIDLLKLKQIPEDEAKSRLTEIWGIGPWSAEMFLMFALGRPDVFSPGDLGLARSIEAIYGLPKNSPREKLLEIAERWIPHRTYACLILWRVRDAKA